MNYKIWVVINLKYRWLHLSDIHFAYKNYDTNRLREELFKKLEEISNHNKIDFLFITGDLTDKNAEYTKELYKFIDNLISTLKLDKHYLFIVPGNHDLERSQPRELLLQSLVKEKDEKFVYDGLDEKTIYTLIYAQNKYFMLYRDLKGEEYPKDTIHFIKKINDVNIIHLNTSWMCGTDREEGKIFIGVNKLYDVLRKVDIKPEELNIAIGHHSIDCLHKRDKEQLNSLFRKFHIDFYLSGHLHKSSIAYDYHTNTHFCSCRQVRSDNYDSGGFILGNIDTENRKSYIEFYKWHQKGYWTHDTDVGPNAPEGIYTINTSKFPSAEHIVIIHKTMNAPLNKNKLLKEMGFENVPVYQYPYTNIEIKSIKEWMKHKRCTETFIRNIISKLDNNVIHLFSLSQIPLLILIGYLFQNDSNDIKVYQLDEEQKWVLDSVDAKSIPLYTDFIESDNKDKKLIVTIEISSKIDHDDIDVYLNTKKHSVIKFTIDGPERYKVLYTSQIKEIKNEFRRTMEKYIGNYEEIHLFCAAPVALSVEIGRCILKSMWPRVFLYNYRKNKSPKYELAFYIN